MLQKAKKNRYNSSDYNNIKYDIEKNSDNEKSSKGTMVACYVIFLVIVGLILITFIGQSLKITFLNYDIENLEQQLSQIYEKKQELNLKIAQNTSLSRIEKLARKRLHMIEPEQMEVVVLQKNSNEIQGEQQTASSNGDNQIYFLQIFNNLWQNINTVRADSLK